MLCDCFGVDNNINENTKKPKIFSEIEETGRPYKTIEAIINNNRIVLRIQKFAHEEAEKWEPSCDCLPNLPVTQLETKYSDGRPSHCIMSSQSPQFPLVHSISPKSQNKQSDISNANEMIENPNIFLLKIRKRSETWDRKKENIDLEFRAPRPWPIPIPKTQKRNKVPLEIKQSEEIEKEKEPLPPKRSASKKKKKKKKKKGKKGKKKKK